ncbi:adenylate/guanylate cyclase domain-containing protein [Williamsia sterculiae]|uniref:Adenylate cyclase, class 3 n=1 Tax=Williamsia sterculiae TaxID=1344003 RepID=A0A1N7EP53_9NOCA|nr:adenylate/guanylate cyclase domain-containing protein [Williamsia sterculiae]SIR89883.1 Adenylate cyclase, class 3 [Williamsia sterculiae]
MTGPRRDGEIEQRDDSTVAPVEKSGRRDRAIAQMLSKTDQNATVLRAARAARRIAPGPGPTVDLPTRDRMSDRVADVLNEGERPSASRELALTAVQLWQSLRAGRRSGTEITDVTILFTDLVGFSSWALRAGDDSVLTLIGKVNSTSDDIISRHGGRVVKTLGDGLMAVFGDASEAIAAAYELCGAVSAITVDGYRPALRAGLHTGTPRKVGDDYLGVDVNVAARVADAASDGEVLATKTALDAADPDSYVRRRKRFRAKGAPRDIEVFSVVPHYGD